MKSSELKMKIDAIELQLMKHRKGRIMPVKVRRDCRCRDEIKRMSFFRK
jgi:hypothetical protein